ncbi:MAG: acetyl-CoA C-acetyltransferase [Gemmatimonadetes bacterium]|nr:acetyl-CoA C-acetyltransferase [Gemmatimonadota bacterium]
MTKSDPRTTPVIVSAARTPIGRYLGALSAISAPALGGAAIRAALERSGVPAEDVDEAIMGHVVQAGTGQAPARQAAYNGGVPETVPAMTINKVCGSGLKAVMLAAQSIRAGDSRAIVAGGQESMSGAPFYLYGHRQGVKFGDQTLVDGVVRDGLWCSFCEVHMGGHAEYTANKAGLTRQQMDEYAVSSHRKAVAAIEAGKFREEIVPVEVPGRKGTTLVDTDEGPRADTSLEALAKLRPAFADHAPEDVKELTVTAGNASSMNDGGAALVIVSEDYANAAGLTILARITGYSTGAVEPRDLFFAPIHAVQKLMGKAGTAISDYDLIEANEAFASQALANGQGLGWDWDRVNVNGGAIALGHPIGASGARVLTTLVHALRDRDKENGLATLCLGGGDAVALSVERAS